MKQEAEAQALKMMMKAGLQGDCHPYTCKALRSAILSRPPVNMPGELTLSELKAYTDATQEEQARIPSPETGQAYSAKERDISVCAGRFVLRIFTSGIYVNHHLQAQLGCSPRHAILTSCSKQRHQNSTTAPCMVYDGMRVGAVGWRNV